MTQQKKNITEMNHIFFRRAGYLFISLLPCVFLMAQFIMAKNQTTFAISQIDRLQYFKYLIIIRPLISLRFNGWQVCSTIIGVTFWILLIYVLIIRLKKPKLLPFDSLLITASFILVGYFFAPDTYASGWFVVPRLMLFFYFFALLWIGINSIPSRLQLSPVLIFAAISLVFLMDHYKEAQKLNDNIIEYLSVADSIQDGSIVLPLSYSYSSMHGNISNYLGAIKNVVILDNYEASKPHFPTMWKNKKDPNNYMRFYSTFYPCTKIEKYETVSEEKIDYVVRWCYTPLIPDSCTQAIDKYICENFAPIFTSEHGKAELFKRRKSDLYLDLFKK